MDPLAEATGWLFGWLLRNSAHASLLALVVFAFELGFWRRLSPRWRYGLWLLVIARLLLPVAPESRVSLFNLVDLAPAGISGAVLQVLGLPTPAGIPVAEPASPLADTPNWFLVALALWFPGAVVLAALIWRDHRRLCLALANTRAVESEAIRDLLSQSKGVMSVRSDVTVAETPGVTSPAIYGWWRPRLLLPQGLLPRLTPDETRFLFLHELAHVKRADIAFNWLLAIIQVLHWFNPIVWFALRRVLAVREEVCDDLVLRRSFPGASRDYGLTLLRILEECAPRRVVPALAGVLDDVGALRRRIRCIRGFASAEPNPWAPATFTVAFAIVGLTERIPEPWAWSAFSTPRVVSASAELTPPPTLRPTASTPRVAPRPAPGETRPIDGTSTPRTQARLVEALKEAVQRAAETGRSGPQPTPSGIVGKSATPDASIEFSTRSASSPVLPSATPARSRPVVPATAVPSQIPSRPGTRMYPLPPVSERGDILRPPRTTTSVRVQTHAEASFRTADIVPPVGRNVYVPLNRNGLQNSP